MILIVDDDRSVTASLALVLKQAGYAAHAEPAPGPALAWLERQPWAKTAPGPEPGWQQARPD